MTERRTAASLLGASILLLGGCDVVDRKPTQMLRSEDTQLVALGAHVYQTRCAACHGVLLQGQPNWRERDAAGRLPAPPHDASGHTWHHPDEVLFNVTKYGMARAVNLKDYESLMPAFQGVLTDAEIIAVLSWIKSQWPADIRKAQEEVNAAHEEQRSKAGAGDR